MKTKGNVIGRLGLKRGGSSHPNRENNNLIGRDRTTYFKNFLTEHTSCKNWNDHYYPEPRMISTLDIIIVKLFVIL